MSSSSTGCIPPALPHQVARSTRCEPTHLGGPGEQVTPAEAFLAGVSACGVLLVQGRARDTGVRLDQVEATIEGIRHRSDTSVFQRVQIYFRLTGPSQSEAIDLVDHYKRR